MPFYDLKDIHEIPLVNGITIKAVYGGSVSVSFLEFPAYATIPPHAHPNEQVGIVTEGALHYTINGDVTRDLEHDGVRVPLLDGGLLRPGRHVRPGWTRGLRGPRPAPEPQAGERRLPVRHRDGKGGGRLPLPSAARDAPPQLLLSYRPNTVEERAGDVRFLVLPLGTAGVRAERKGQVPVGGQFDAGGFVLSPREIRYWVGLDVRYDPGLTVILASLCLGLGGMVLAFVGRLRQGAGRRRVGSGASNGHTLAAAGVRGESR